MTALRPQIAHPTPARRRAPAATGHAVLRRTVLALALIGTLVPLLYLVSVSLMDRGEVGAGVLVPSSPRWENWVAAWTESTLPSALLNSIVVALGGAFLTLVFALPGAWAIVRFRAGGRALSASILAPWLLPPIVAVVPLFTLLRLLGLNNTVIGLVLVYAFANVAIAIWLLQGFVQKLPIELEEAAAIDGAGTWRTLLTVVTPLLAPGLIAVGIVVAVLNYNEFLFALFLTQGPQSQTVPVALSLMLAERVQDFGKIAAAALIGVIPVFAAAVFLQRGLVSGLTAGAVK